MVKKLLISLGFLGAVGTVSAQVLPPNFPAPTSDWGCEVLLCLANPGGPMQYGACVPPITRLWRAMARLRFTFPSCAMASGPNGASWAQLDSNYYDACPSGTTALAPGQTALYTPPAPPNSPLLPNTQIVLSGIGDGVGLGPTPDNPDLGTKICVSGYQGDTTVVIGNGEDASTITVGFYSRIVQLAPNPTPGYISVFVDNQLFKTVRP